MIASYKVIGSHDRLYWSCSKDIRAIQVKATLFLVGLLTFVSSGCHTVNTTAIYDSGCTAVRRADHLKVHIQFYDAGSDRVSALRYTIRDPLALGAISCMLSEHTAIERNDSAVASSDYAIIESFSSKSQLQPTSSILVLPDGYVAITTKGATVQTILDSDRLFRMLKNKDFAYTGGR